MSKLLLKVIHAMPRMQNNSVMPENTPTILPSLQPLISKWWWIGLILKIRLPVVLKLMTCNTTDKASTM